MSHRDPHKASCELWLFDLQLFADEKTEEPTTKRRDDARKKGQVAKSNELVSALVFLMVFGYLRYYGSEVLRGLVEMLQYSLSDLTGQELNGPLEYTRFVWALSQLLSIGLPVLLVALVTGVAANLAQVGFYLTSEPLTPQLDRLNFINGFGRIFSKRSLVELGKSLLKLVLISAILWQGIQDYLPRFLNMMGADLLYVGETIVDAVLDLAMRVALFQLALAIFDYWFQRRTFENSIKMSKQDIKDEMKQTEGNPQIKARVRERQRAMSMHRMMQELPSADVVITNPTHFAVALSYDEAEMQAPRVVAKGQDFLAQRIKALALEHRILIVEDKPLAQALYKSMEVGEYVTPEFYKAVAEVLAYVYRAQNRVSARR